MKKETLLSVKANTEILIKRINSILELTKEKALLFIYITGYAKNSGSIKRASTELTRSLINLKQNR